MRLLYVAQENNKGIRHTNANALIICLDDKTMPVRIADNLRVNQLILHVFGNLLVPYPYYFIALNVGKLQVNLVVYHFLTFL